MNADNPTQALDEIIALRAFWQAWSALETMDDGDNLAPAVQKLHDTQNEVKAVYARSAVQSVQ